MRDVEPGEEERRHHHLVERNGERERAVARQVVLAQRPLAQVARVGQGPRQVPSGECTRIVDHLRDCVFSAPEGLDRDQVAPELGGVHRPHRPDAGQEPLGIGPPLLVQRVHHDEGCQRGPEVGDRGKLLEPPRGEPEGLDQGGLPQTRVEDHVGAGGHDQWIPSGARADNPAEPRSDALGPGRVGREQLDELGILVAIHAGPGLGRRYLALP